MPNDPVPGWRAEQPLRIDFGPHRALVLASRVGVPRLSALTLVAACRKHDSHEEFRTFHHLTLNSTVAGGTSCSKSPRSAPHSASVRTSPVDQSAFLPRHTPFIVFAAPPESPTLHVNCRSPSSTSRCSWRGPREERATEARKAQ